MSNIRYELLDTGPAAHGSPQLLYVTSAQYGPDWQGSMHAHTCTELFYCVRGIGEFRLTDRAQPVGSDDLIIVNPHVEHTETSFSSNPLEYIVLGVNGLDLQLAGEPSPFTVLNCRQQRSEMLFYLREFVREAEKHAAGLAGGVPAPAGCISHQAVPPGGAAPGAGRYVPGQFRMRGGTPVY